MTKGMLTAIICSIVVCAFIWTGIAHNDQTASLRSRIGRAYQTAILANQKAEAEKLGYKYTAPILPPAS